MKVDLTIDKPRGVTRTTIEWADYTANPIRARDIETGEVGWHCRKVSAGCANCYAEAINNRFGTKRAYTAKAGGVRGGVEQVLDVGVLRKILRMRPKPGPDGLFKNGRTRPALFLGDMMDLFYGDDADRKACEAAGVPFEPILFEWIRRILVCALVRPDIDFLILTKRPGRMAQCMKWMTASEQLWAMAAQILGRGVEAVWPLPNVGLGTIVEDQATADERSTHLLKCPAAVRFLSCEPLLESVDLKLKREVLTDLMDADAQRSERHRGTYPFNLEPEYRTRRRSWLHWVIAGGESGPGARPCNVEWIRSIVRQCKSAGVPVFVKQLGTVVWDRNDAGFDGDPHDAWDYSKIKDVQHHPDGDATVYQGAPVRVVLNDPKGGDPSEWPEDLSVREMPEGATHD